MATASGLGGGAEDAGVAIVVVGPSALPAELERGLVQWSGARAADRTLEFLTASIRNPNTRRAYGRAVERFVRWCQEHALPLPALRAPHVAAYVEQLCAPAGGGGLSALSVKLHLRRALASAAARSRPAHAPPR